MNLIHFCITNPVKVTVAVLLMLLFGMIALFAIPVQLTPNVDQPIITVQTSWVGRSPEEVEREIIEKQEEKLKGITNLRKMTATASQGRAEIKLEFLIGTDMTRSLQEASDKLREVESYPDEVDQPVIVAADSAIESPIAWLILSANDPNFDVQTVFMDIDKRVKPILERVEGVSQINVYGGLNREVHIRVDPRRMAERGITFNVLRRALQLQNVNISAGDLAEGRLDVRVRTVGQYDNLEDVRRTIVTYSTSGPVRIKDLAEVELTYEKRRAFVHSKGAPGMAINAIRQTGANVIQVMNGLRGRLDQINGPNGILVDIAREITQEQRLAQPLKLTLEQVYDETHYIHDAINLVVDNIWQGGILAVLTLLVFMRKLRPTFIISLTIPISIIGTFAVLAVLGRNLNVVSLAGLAFAVGVVVDNANVVLENIDRHIGMGKSVFKATHDGTTEVWLAILASTGTTLVVFLPVLVMQEEAGQLFRDISLAICASVALSLVLAITVIPAACAAWLKPHEHRKHAWAEQVDQLGGLGPAIGKLNTAYADFVHWLSNRPTWSTPARALRSLVGALLGLAGAAGLLIGAGQIDTVKQLLSPSWIMLFGLQLMLMGGLTVALLGWMLARHAKFQQRVGTLGIGVLMVTAGLLVVLGLYFMIAFYNTQSLLMAVGSFMMGWQIWLALLLVFVGWVLLQPGRLAVVSFFTLASVVGAYLMAPPMTYLPAGNQNLVFGIMLAPPAYSLEQGKFIADRMEANLRPFWEAKTYAETDKLGPVQGFNPFTMSMVTVPHVPPIENFFYVYWNGQIFYGASSLDKQNVQPLEALLPWGASNVPGVIPLAFQSSIFGRGLGGANTIDVDVVGNDMPRLRRAAQALQGALQGKYGFMAVRPEPMNFNLPAPELQLTIDRVRAADLGVNVSDLGAGIQALVDGLNIGDYRYQGESIDLLITREKEAYPLNSDTLALVPLAVMDGDGSAKVIPLSSVADFRRADAPQEIKRVEQQRAITLMVEVPAGQPLAQAMDEINAMVAPMREKGDIPPGIDVNLGGTADKLVQTREALLGQVHESWLETVQSILQSRMFIALLITYFLMCALFESWIYPFVIMFSVPLAAIGGFLGLRISHEFYPTQLLDVVTMLGFVILIGNVVNNAILIVAQALNFMRGFGESEQDKLEKAMTPRQAIREAVRTRMRPVMMTTLTTLIGLIPLVVKPGSGSEIYRGLGSVVLGGLLVSTLFTLLVVPVVFSLVLDIKIALYTRLGWPLEPELTSDIPQR